LGFTFLRRLTNAEYRASVADLLGTTRDVTKDFPPDSLARGFSNNSEAIAISTLHAERYQSAAESLVDEVFADPPRRAALLGCEITAPECLSAFTLRFGKLAFRRPLREDESAAFTALSAAAAGDLDSYAGARLVLEAALQSPSFLFRIEEGAAQPDGRAKLSGHELAARLAFLLQGRAPDSALLSAAEAGQLDSAEGLRAAAQLTIASGAAQDALSTFTSEWLHLGQLQGVRRDAVAYPMFSDSLVGAMREETSRFVREVLWTAGSDALTLLSADFTFVDSQLASLYGLAAAASDGFQKVLLPEGRRGLLTQPSILTLTSSNEAATLIHRGKFIRDAILCDSPPPPPADIPVLAAMDGESAAEQLDRHAADPVCRGCHDKLEPLGIGFQRFDSLGRYRSVDAQGASVAQAGRINGFEPAAFDGPADLAARLAQAPEVSACLVKQLFRYSFGRSETDADSCTLYQLGQGFQKSQHSFSALLLDLVAHDAFRYRAAQGSEEK